MHWDHEPGRANGPLSPTLSPSEGAREKRRKRALQFARFMESPPTVQVPPPARRSASRKP
ncbi:hypothetical protein SBV1_720012 [Verrucomicrobia bacterium]|nr:hypothetical protein SBV1_720012 [Verrucomicrobiota bacterium]